MKVRDIMETQLEVVPVDASYEDVARILYTKNISGLPVVDGQGNLVGAVSEKDLFRIMYPYYKSYYEHPESYVDYEQRENKIDEIRSHPVRSFMTKEVLTIDPEAPVMRAGALMLARNINRLPVVEEGRVIGVISRSHIYRKILRYHFEIE
ncbi:MAG: CBS domain-containing protein [Patescibacteria group bacterium]|nr:CBS domain-containing protein [Patescibacteria group bacterium]